MAGLFESIFGSGGQDVAQKAADSYKNVSLPDIEKMKLQLEELVSQGEISPEEAAVILQETNAFENVSTDPRLRESQLKALSGVEEIVNGQGLTAADRANINKVQSENARAERGSREAILQNAQQRGVGGSGLEIAAQLQNSQESAQRNADAGLEISKQAQQRALEALNQQASMSGNLRSQDYNEQAQKAQAQNTINQFNAANRNAASMANTQARNTAQATNLQNKQNIANANTAQRNAAQQYNKQLEQKGFENNLALTAGKTGAMNYLADQKNKEREQDANMFGNLIETGAKLYASDERVKKDVEPFDASSFLDKITGYKYSYKNPKKHGEGEQIGVMAQDVEKVLPQAVVKNEEGTKMLDSAKIAGPALAALANLNERMKKMEGK